MPRTRKSTKKHRPSLAIVSSLQLLASNLQVYARSLEVTFEDTPGPQTAEVVDDAVPISLRWMGLCSPTREDLLRVRIFSFFFINIDKNNSSHPKENRATMGAYLLQRDVD
jgi:hypothetical protein